MRPVFDRVRVRLERLAYVAMPLAALAGVGGCSLVLGFEDTTLRADTEGGAGEGGGPGDEGGPSVDSGASHLSVKPTSISRAAPISSAPSP